jgi:hypothetical protein
VSIRFLADEDIHAALVRGLRLREPSMDILDVKAAGLRGTNVDLLEFAWAEGRVVLSHDRTTMTARFSERIASGKATSGLCIVPQHARLREVIEPILVIWAASSHEQWIDRIEYIPLRYGPLQPLTYYTRSDGRRRRSRHFNRPTTPGRSPDTARRRRSPSTSTCLCRPVSSVPRTRSCRRPGPRSR